MTQKYLHLPSIKIDGEYPKDAQPPFGCDYVKDKYICAKDFGS